jgi:dienelactone hydrolase
MNAPRIVRKRHRSAATTTIAALSAAVLVLTACGSGGGDDSSTDISTTVAAPTTEAAETTVASETTVIDDLVADDIFAYIEPGPFPVGVTTLQLDRGPSVEVWYPAVDTASGTETYDIREFTPEAIQAILTGDANATFTYAAERDAEPADGTFPVVLFSHGFTGVRVQSTFLTSHLASWGMIVAAPDHPSRDLPNVLSNTNSGDQDEAVADLLATLELVVTEGEAGGRFDGRVDADQVAALGHSAGGGTIVRAALDDRIDGYVSMAAGGPADTSEFPQTPSFFMAGETDAVVTPTDRTRPAFETAPEPTWYWEIEATGHNGFDDFCTFGNGTGIIGVAEASGLGALLDAQPQLRSLGEDGCIAPAAPVEQAFPIIRHGATAWLRWLFGIDSELVGFGPAVEDGYELGVIALQRP